MDDLTFGSEEKKKTRLGKNRPLVDTSELSVKEAIYRIIKTYLKEHSYLKLECLVNDDIGRTTLYNFMRLYPQKKLSNVSILGLMRSVHNNLSLLEVSNLYDGKLGNFLKESKDRYGSQSKDRYASPVFQKRVKEGDSFLIFLLASSEEGVSIEELKKSYGDSFIRRVENYIQQGELVKRHGRFYLKNNTGSDTSLNLRTTFELAKHLINSNFKVGNLGDKIKSNILHFLIGRVNPDHPAIKEKLPKLNRQYIEEVRKIFDEAKGDQPIWVALFGDWLLDFLLKKPNNDEHNGVLQ